jgi:sulfur-carrier protein
MRVTLYATFRLLAGVKTLDVDLLDGCTVMEAIQRIVDRYPILRNAWLNQDGELHAHVHVFLNGSEVPTLPHGFETSLKTNDELDFFPPVAGGIDEVL